MQLVTYLHFDGQCQEAFKFYEKCLGGKIESVFTYGASPAASQTPPEWQDKVMHLKFVVEGNVIMAADAPPPRYNKPQGFSVSLNVQDAAEAERIYQALSEGATIHMPLQKTFFAEKFAMFADRFGTPWMIVANPAE